MKKTQRHETYWAKNPPMEGPAIAEIAHTLDR